MPPGQQRAPTASSSTPTSAPATAPSTQSSRAQATRGNAAVAAGLPSSSIGANLPTDIELQRAGVSFELPGETALTGDWNQLETTRRTTVSISMSGQDLRVHFSPPLTVDAQWPVSNVAWSGFTWDFSRGCIASVGLEDTQVGFSASSTVRTAVTDFANGLLRGSPLGRPGYNPLQDPDLAGTLRKVQGNFSARPSGKPGNLKAEDIGGFALNAEAKTRTAIRAGAGEGGVALPAGASLSLSVALAGSGATIASRAPSVQSVHLSSSDLTLEHKGKPVAKLRSVRVDRGGVVDVVDFEPLGSLAQAGAGESLIRLLGVVAALQGGDPRLAGNGDIRSTVVDGLAEKKMEEALTQAVQSLVREHHDVIPGMDLRAVLGVAGPKT